MAVWSSAGKVGAIKRRLGTAVKTVSSAPKVPTQPNTSTWLPPPGTGTPFTQTPGAQPLDPAHQTLQQLAGYNPEIAAAMSNLGLSRADIASNQEMSTRHEQDAYNRAGRDLGTSHDRALSQLEANMADQGILRSGIYANEQGRVGTDYTTQVGDLASQHAGNLESIDRGAASAYGSVAQQEAQLQAQQAEAAVQQQLQQALIEAQNQVLQAAQPQRSPTGQMTTTPAPAQNPSVTPSKGSGWGPAVKRRLGW